MRNALKSVLDGITSARDLESEFLNTLSLLEFLGARKISHTVAEHHPSTEILEHLANETRHAAALKRLAVEVYGAEPGYLVEEATVTYFSRLDRELAAWVEDLVGEPEMMLTYQLVSSMIERRAMELYPLFRQLSATTSVREVLRGIIIEEQGHRAGIETSCLDRLREYGINSLAAAEVVEQTFFTQLLEAMSAEVEARLDYAQSA